MIGRWYCTYQIECDRCGQTYGTSSVDAEHAAEKHERMCGGEVWAVSMVLPYAPDPLLPVSAIDALVNEACGS